MRGPKLKSANVTKTSQVALHAHICESRRDIHEKLYADRDVNSDDPARRFNQWIYDMGPDLPAPPVREVVSEQSVMTFRDITFASTVPPDMRQVFTAEELDALVEEDAVRPLTSPDFFRHISRIEDSRYPSLVGFQSDSQEAAEKTHEERKAKQAAKLRRRAERAGHKVAEAVETVDDAEKKKAREKAEKYTAILRSKKAAIADRYQHGWYFAGGKIAGDIYPAMHEYYGPNILRSHLGSPSLARFAQIMPRSGKIRAGYDKTYVIPAESKIDALDAPYAEADRRFLRMIVQEFDVVAKSAGAFRSELLKILGPKLMPNLMVGRTPRYSSRFAKMHCIWFLDPRAEIVDKDGNKQIVDACVWNDQPRQWIDADTGEVEKLGDPRCQTGPIEKYWMVHRALKKMLLPLGCDPAFSNVWKPKCALSGFWTTVITNDDCFFTLDDFVSLPDFDADVDLKDLEEQATKMRAEAAGKDHEPKLSDLYWRTVGAAVVPLTMLQLKVREEFFLNAGKKSIEALASWFDAKIRPDLEKEFPAAGEALDVVIARRCTFAAKYALGKLWRPRRRQANRGRDRELIYEDMTTKQRRRQSCERSGQHRHDVHMWNLKKEMHVQLWTTGELRKTEFIKNVGTVSKSFAYKHWDEAVAGLKAAFHDGVYRYTASPFPVGTSNLPPSILALRELDSGSSATLIPADTVGTVRAPWEDDDDGPPEVGLRDHQRSTHAFDPVDVCLDVVDHEPEAVGA